MRDTRERGWINGSDGREPRNNNPPGRTERQKGGGKEKSVTRGDTDGRGKEGKTEGGSERDQPRALLLVR